MADLIIYLPSHGYSESDYVTVSWLGSEYYVRDVGAEGDTFKVSTDDSDDNIIQYSEDITDGYCRVQTGTAITTIGGLEHLEGETVAVTSNGQLIGDTFVVSGGEIDVGQEVLTYQVGIPHVMKIRTMRLEVPQVATNQTRIKNINETVIRHLRSKSGMAGQEHGGTEYLNDLNAIFSRKSADSVVTTRGGFSPDGYTSIKSSDPYPFTAVSAIISFSVDESR